MEFHDFLMFLGKTFAADFLSQLRRADQPTERRLGWDMDKKFEPPPQFAPRERDGGREDNCVGASAVCSYLVMCKHTSNAFSVRCWKRTRAGRVLTAASE